MSDFDDIYTPLRTREGKEVVARNDGNDILNPTGGTYYEDENGNIVSAENVEGLSNSEKNPVKENQSTSDVDSQTKAEKEHIAQEIKTLTGRLEVTPSLASIKIKASETVRLEGFGTYLTGEYYVSAVTRTISASNGYTHSFDVFKNGFGSLKEEPAETPADSENTRETPEELDKEVEE